MSSISPDEPAKHEETLAALALKHRLRTLPLTVFDGKSGPKEIAVAKSGKYRAVLEGPAVKQNFAFEEGKMDANAVENVVLGLNSILE